MAEIYVKIEPESEEFRIELNSIPKFFLEQKAENNRANVELLNRLEKILDEKPAIISGHRSRRKKLKTSVTEQEFRNKLEQGF